MKPWNGCRQSKGKSSSCEWRATKSRRSLEKSGDPSARSNASFSPAATNSDTCSRRSTQMASPMVASPTLAELDGRVEAFESAWKAGRRADLSEFLPASDDSHYLAVLCELVRVDMELHWDAGQRRALNDYLAEFPALRKDREALAEVAFEEYRQRLRSGEHVQSDAYQQAFGINVSRWPKPEPASGLSKPPGEDGPETQEFSDKELE